MRTRLSELEQLRLEKKILIEECKQYEEDFKRKINYSKSNFGHLLLNSIVSSAKNGFIDIAKPSRKKSKKENYSKKALDIGQIFIATAPFLWEIFQPLLIGLAVKKAKSIFIKKRKK